MQSYNPMTWQTLTADAQLSRVEYQDDMCSRGQRTQRDRERERNIKKDRGRGRGESGRGRKRETWDLQVRRIICRRAQVRDFPARPLQDAPELCIQTIREEQPRPCDHVLGRWPWFMTFEIAIKRPTKADHGDPRTILLRVEIVEQAHILLMHRVGLSFNTWEILQGLNKQQKLVSLADRHSTGSFAKHGR